MTESTDNGESGAVKMPGQDDRHGTDHQPTKIVRVLTVVAYICSVSMAAVMLSLYYVFLWNPEPHTSSHPSRYTQPMAFSSGAAVGVSSAASAFSPSADPPTASGPQLLQTLAHLVTQSASTTPRSDDSATSSPFR